MGAYLSQPITDKETEDGGEHGGLRWGAAAMQGWRTGMEDAHLACLDLNQKEENGDDHKPVALFAVFDGHGGAEVAKYCATHMCDVVRNTKGYKEGELMQGLKQAYLQIDDMIRTPRGQEELTAIKATASEDDSDSGDAPDEDEVLSKMPPEMHAMIMEQMKKAISRDQFTSGGTLEGGMGAGGGEDNSEDDSEDEDYEGSNDSEEEEEEEDNDEGREGGKEMDLKKEGARNVPEMEAGSSEDGKGVGFAAGVVDMEGMKVEEGGKGDGNSVEGMIEGNEKEARGGLGGEEEDEEDEEKSRQGEFRSSINIAKHHRQGYDCGATAVLGLLVGEKTLVVANAGDSRCVVSRKGVSIDMSTDHKPEDQPERERIAKAGGHVMDGRVQGNLNLSRAIGDLTYKADDKLTPEEQMITANPELQSLDIEDEDEFVVFACDGVWNVLSSQEVVDFVRERLAVKTCISAICCDLCDACCAETSDGDGTGLDNVTALIVLLHTPAAEALIASSEKEKGLVQGEGAFDEGDSGKRKSNAGVEGSGVEVEGGGADGTNDKRRKGADETMAPIV
ncbi:unnamed protein product [Choristocarpus tenellus]